MTTTTRPGVDSRSVALLVGGILLVAANLRTGLTSVGPVLPQLRTDLGLGATLAGVLGALPLLGFAAVAPLTPVLARRLGTERTLVLGLTLLVAGTVARSLGGAAVVFAATMVLAAGIGTANVLLPVLVRKVAPERVGLITSWYVATLALTAAGASGLAVPIADAAPGGWRTALGCWALVSVVALVVWTPAAWRGGAPRARPSDGSGSSDGSGTSVGSGSRGPAVIVWRSRTAWAVTAYFGLQAASFYCLLAWLPTVLAERGTTAAAAGLHLLVLQLAGLIGGLSLPLALRGRPDQRAVAAGAAVLTTVGCTGLALAGPGTLTWVWTVVGGLGSGAMFTMALTLVALRAADPVVATSLSAMAQFVGYLFAAAGPPAVGALHDITGGWTVALLLLALVAAATAVAGLRAGAARTVG